MTKYLKLIWFAEDPWTKYHAAVGIRVERNSPQSKKTLCGIMRSTRAILPSEKFKSYPVKEKGWKDWREGTKCSKCLAALRKHYGAENIEKVKVG